MRTYLIIGSSEPLPTIIARTRMPLFASLGIATHEELLLAFAVVEAAKLGISVLHVDPLFKEYSILQLINADVSEDANWARTIVYDERSMYARET